MGDRDDIQPCRVESRDVLLESQQKQPCYCPLEMRDGCHGLAQVLVDIREDRVGLDAEDGEVVRVQLDVLLVLRLLSMGIVRVISLFDEVGGCASAGLEEPCGYAFLDMGVLGRHVEGQEACKSFSLKPQE